MSEMKVIMENWEGFITELEIEKKAAQGITWAQLKGAIEVADELATGKVTAERKKVLLGILGTVGLTLAATLATGGLGAALGIAAGAQSAAETITKMFRLFARESDEKTKDNPVLALFNLDDGFEDLIDDKLEDAFVNHMLPKIEKMADTAPNEPIEDMDKVVNLWLSKQALGPKKDSTGNVASKTNTGQ